MSYAGIIALYLINAVYSIRYNNPYQMQRCNEVFQSRLNIKKVNNFTTGDVFMDQMLEAHLPFTENHGALPFKHSEEMQHKADDWCQIQKEVDCDMVYPTGVAFNAALVSSTYCPHDVVQLWYNERRHINPKKSMYDNILAAQEAGVEIIHYLNIVSNYHDRQIGCCAIKCTNKHYMLYGCAYGKVGVGYWALKEKELPNMENSKVYEGFYLHLSDVALVEIPPPAKKDMVESIAQERIASVGCSAHVSGNGPNRAISPFKYYCHYLKSTENQSMVIPSVQEQPDQDSLEQRNEFIRLRKLEFGSCEETSLKNALPVLLYCDPECEKPVPYDPETMDIDIKYTSVCAKAQVAYYELNPTIPLNVHSPTIFEVKSQNEDSFTLQQGLFSSHKCSEITYNFFGCSEKYNDCVNLDYRLPSMHHPWIFTEIRHSHLSSFAYNIMMLKDSLCEAANLTITLQKDEKLTGKIALLGHYVSPSVFTILELDLTKQIISATSCRDFECTQYAHKETGTFIANKPIILSLIKSHDTQVILNNELVARFEDSRPKLGFFGIAFNNYTSIIDIIQNVTLKRIRKPKIETEWLLQHHVKKRKETGGKKKQINMIEEL